MLYLRKRYAFRQEATGEGDGGASGADGGEGEVVAEASDPQEGQTEGANQEIETEARKMGWTPKEDFRGDPDKWRDAAEFVERGRNMLPILRKTVEKQQAELADLKKSMKEFAEYHSKTEQRAYAKAYGDLKAQQMEAVAAGDTEAFQEVDEKIENLQKEVAKNRPPAPPKDDDPADDPVYNEWASRNKWVDTDKEMAAYAEGQGLYLNKMGMRGPELLEEVTKLVKAKFPDKFSNPRRAAAPSVEGSTSVAKKAGKTYADMPKEARDACDRAVQRFGIKRDDYVKTYHEEN